MEYPEDFINKVVCGDCLEVLKTFPDNSIDTIITDPPYNLSTIKRFKAKDSGEKWNVKSGVFHRTSKGFMGKEWDNEIAFWKETWEAVYRVAKPGATLLCFGGTRTFHRLACAIEDAGWIIKDCILWLYGQGFPKSHNVANAIDKKMGMPQRGHAIASGSKYHPTTGKPRAPGEFLPPYKAKTKEAKEWEGYGSALKPAYEPIIMAMKPNEGSYAENALKWGVAGLNIDGGRIPFEETKNPATNPKYRLEAGYKLPARGQKSEGAVQFSSSKDKTNIQGRFRANLILDEESAKMLDEMSGESKSTGGRIGKKNTSLIDFGLSGKYQKGDPGFGDSGGASRFFKVIKPYYYQDKEYQVEGFIKKCKPKAPSNYNDKGRTSRYFKVIK